MHDFGRSTWLDKNGAETLTELPNFKLTATFVTAYDQSVREPKLKCNFFRT